MYRNRSNINSGVPATVVAAGKPLPSVVYALPFA